jgi:ribosomal-protein-alanine N-acetyltransferase
MTIRDATAVDLPAIAAIQSASPEAAQWNPADYLAHRCRVAELDGSVAGFIVTRPTAPGENEILNLAVAPAYRRRGVARALLEAELAASGAWRLEVRESNAAARALYRTLGFRESGHRKNYYCNPSETAIVLTRQS